LLGLALSACSLILQTDATQCSSDADCKKRGAAFANATCMSSICQPLGTTDPLSCVGNVKPAPSGGSGTVSITMSFYDPVTGTRDANIAVRPCGKLDVSCTSPIGPSVKSDASGNATFDLPSAFDGYLEMTGTDTVPALWYFSPFPTKDGSYNVGLFSPGSFQNIAKTVGATIDPNAGHAFTFALDCTATYGTFAKGVSFASDKTTSETRSFYLINGLPSTTADRTDPSGIGGFANLPPGVVTMTSTVAASGARIGSVSTLIRAGVVTFAPIAPSP
jgi:hypothetical protein